MNNSSSVSSSYSTAATISHPSKLTDTQNKNKDTVDDIITTNEKVNLTKQQHEVLKIICNTYETSISEYMQQALVEAMRFDIKEGNFCDPLLEKIGSEDSKKNDSSSHLSPPSDIADLMKNELDLLKRLQTLKKGVGKK